MVQQTHSFYQPHLSPEIPKVIGNKDYKEFRSILERIDTLLVNGAVEAQFVSLYIKHYRKELTELLEKEEEVSGAKEKVGKNDSKAPSCPPQLTPRAINRLQKLARKALRCNIARKLIGGSFRSFTNRLADSSLFQWFCLIDHLAVVSVPAKSSLDRYDKLVPEQIVHDLINDVTIKATQPDTPQEDQVLGLNQPIDIHEAFIDASCIKANIHFPVDWVLLRDVILRLIPQIIIIRNQGLKHRMPPPEDFIQKINTLCLAMANCRRKAGASKKRKRILRLMKKVVKKVRVHAQSYRDLLIGRYSETSLTENEMKLIVQRMDKILNQIPQALKQAHERIIGERPVNNEDKILSLHESEIHVIVRGKAGAEVEYGNSWLLVEQNNGIIIYSRLIKEQPPADCNLPIDALEKINEIYSSYPGALAGDRGFDSEEVRDFLADKTIYNGICPRDPNRLKERIKEDRFRQLQKRRSQIEGRIGLFKNSFLGGLLRSKGFLHRQLGVTWAILAHNLWCLARLPVLNKEGEQTAAT